MKKFSHDIIGKIKKEHIAQKPELIFLLKNFGFWGFFLLSVFLGGTAFSLVIYAIFDIDFEILAHPIVPLFQYFLTVVPLIWIVSVFIFLFLAHIFIKNTKKGYKIPITYLLIGNISASLILGIIFYFFGEADFLDQRTPLGDPRYHQQMEFWGRPEEGFLSGKMLEIKENKIFLLEDFTETLWTVDGTSLPEQFWEIAPEKFVGEQIRVLGEALEENHFVAERVFPWVHGRDFPGRGGGMGRMQMRRGLDKPIVVEVEE